MTSPLPPRPRDTREEKQKEKQKAPLVPVPRWLMLVAFIAVIAAGGATLWVTGGNHQTPRSTSVTTTPSAAIASAATAPVAADYDIDAAFYRVGRDGESRLEPGGRVERGDQMFLKFQASVPLNLYVVNEDDMGETFLLFPLPGYHQTNPIQASQPITLPETTRWLVTSAGGHEHFVVFASPDRMESFEQAFAALPSPRENTPIDPAPLGRGTIERLRGVGGLTPETSKQSPGIGLWHLFTTPLTNARETVHGLWVRQITLDNPGR
jgi:hypothetical protein